MPRIIQVHKHDAADVLIQMRDIYEDSFSDAIPFDILRSLDGDIPGISMDAIISGDEVYGFAYTLTKEWMTYILCLVVREDLRDNGYGTMLIAHIKGNACDSGISTITADIEGYNDSDVTSVQSRRASFYNARGMIDIGKSAFDDGEHCVGDRLMCITDGAHSYDEICNLLKKIIHEDFEDGGFHEIGTPIQDGMDGAGFIMMIPDDFESDDNEA